MKKHLLLSAALVAVSCASASATVTIEGSETEYNSISEAVAAAENGAVILVSESCTESEVITLPEAMTITVKGSADGVVVSYGGNYLVSSQNSANVLTIENLTLRYNLSSATTRSTIAIGRGSLNMKDVVIEDANITGVNGVIMLNNGNSNIPAATLDNVKIVNSTVEAPAQVIVNNSTLSLAGDTELSIQLKGTNTIKDAAGLTGHVTLVLDADRAAGSAVVKGCSDPSLFTLAGVDGMRLKAVDRNLVLAEIPAIENVTTGAEYTALNTAVTAAESGDVIVLNKDVTVTGSISVGGKTLVIKGAKGTERIVRGDNFDKYLFLLNNRVNNPEGTADDLTIDNLVIDGNDVVCTAAMLQPNAGANLRLVNVTVRNCYTTNALGLLDNRPGGNRGYWHLNGVNFVDCTVSDQLVTANAEGNTIKGNNSLSLNVVGNVTVDAEGVDNETPVEVYVADVVENKIVITNCPSDNQFVCANDGYHFSLDNGNLVLHQTIYTGIDNIEAAVEGDAKWYNLRGEAVVPSIPGIYIVRRGNTVAKVYVR